ncbi:MAG: hypothetical protein RSA40_02450 [Malacoplasma sp.]
MATEISKMIVDLLARSEKTVYKLYKFASDDITYKPTLEEIEKFRNIVIGWVKKENSIAKQLFPIINYLEKSNLTEENTVYDDSLFSVSLDDKIAMASPIQVLDAPLKKDQYDIKIEWDFTDIEERESAVYEAAFNYFQLIKADELIKRFLEIIGLFQENFLDITMKENEFFTENIPQEVFALHQTDDLNYLLPTELAQLDDPELEILFYKSFIEKKLLSYQLWGIYREIAENYDIFKKKKEGYGDLIICLDTSGSMRGMNEVISKAFVLTLASLIQELDIPIVFCTFSKNAKFTVLSKEYFGKQFKIISKELKKSFYGGTDFDNLVKEIHLNFSNLKFKRANILVISDFNFKILSPNTAKLIQKMTQEKEIAFHALSISDKTFSNVILDDFKTTWSYTFLWNGPPYIQNELIQELVNVNVDSSDLSSVHTFGILKMLSGKSFVNQGTDENESLLEDIKQGIEDANFIKEKMIQS